MKLILALAATILASGAIAQTSMTREPGAPGQTTTPQSTPQTTPQTTAPGPPPPTDMGNPDVQSKSAQPDNVMPSSGMGTTRASTRSQPGGTAMGGGRMARHHATRHRHAKRHHLRQRHHIHHRHTATGKANVPSSSR